MINIKSFSSSLEFTCSTFAKAIAKAESIRNSGDSNYYTILIESSSCTEYIKTSVSGFYFKSLGKVEIHGSKAAKDLDDEGKELTTWKTATVKILGENNIFEGISFYNDRNNPSLNGQLVALEVLGDNNLFINCTLVSTQDTLFVGPLPDDLVSRYQGFLPDDERYHEGNTLNIFDNCTIKGSIDFIFGAGQALFDNCTLVSVEDGRKGPFYVVAPSHSLKDPVGYIFNECKFTHEFKEIKDVYLARPWRDYGKATFINCTYDKHILKEGFANWDGEHRTTTARLDEYPLLKGRVSWANRSKLDRPRKEILDIIKEYNN